MSTSEPRFHPRVWGSYWGDNYSDAVTPLRIDIQAQLKLCRITLGAKWCGWITSIVGFLLVLLSWPVAAQTPFPVVTGLSNPSALALDGNYIYFGENPGSTGHLTRAPKTGGPREQLLTGKALNDSGNLYGILGIDFSPTHIYFGYGGYVNFHVYRSTPRMMKDNSVAARGCLMS